MSLRDLLLRSTFGALAATACLAPCTAQLQQNLALANGTHSWAAPYWTENVADPAAEAGVVDHLNYVFWLELHSQAVLLQPGTYIAQAKVAKLTSTTGRYDLTVRAEAAGTVLGTSTLAAAAQTVGSYVWSPEVIFTLHQPTLVDISVRNTNGLQKSNYRFDTARIGLVPVGPVTQHDSLDTWSYSNPTYLQNYVAEPTAVYGRVTRRDSSMWGLTWLDLRKTIAMPAGTSVCNVRVRNQNGPGLGSEDLTFVAYDGTTVLQTVTIPATSQPAGVWVESPNLVLNLANATNVTFEVSNHLCQHYAEGYQFDSFSVRSATPSWTPYGQGCGGLTLSQLTPAQVGNTAVFQITNAPTGIFGLYIFGAPAAPTSLDFVGALGCSLFLQPTVTLSAPVIGGSSSLAVGLPAWPELFGYPLDVQGAVLDPTAPGSVYVSNAGSAIVGL